jgi:hypothetical protein
MQFKIVRYQRLAGPEKPDVKGAGDLLARIVKPIARKIDRIFGTRFEDCGGCEERRKWLNEKLPL